MEEDEWRRMSGENGMVLSHQCYLLSGTRVRYTLYHCECPPTPSPPPPPPPLSLFLPPLPLPLQCASRGWQAPRVVADIGWS